MNEIKRGLLLAAILMVPVMAFATGGIIESAIPNTDAGWGLFKIIGTIIGAGLLVSFGTIFHKIFIGIGCGIIVKSWNQLVEGKTALRFGTATSCYDPVISKIGWFAVWTETIEKDGTVVTDRIPYILIVDNRVTVVSNTRVVAKL